MPECLSADTAVNKPRPFASVSEPKFLFKMVRIMETRPLSKDKRWRLVEIIEKAK